MSWFGQDTDENGFSYLDLGIGQNSPLYQMLMASDIVPGDNPSYELCKIIFVNHPLGGKMTESPVKLAQSQEREIKISTGPEERLKKAFTDEWKAIGADMLIRNTKTLSKVYGQAALVMGQKGIDPSEPIDFAKLDGLYFNVLDPLNTAGSLVLNQDPNAPDFLKPRHIRSGSQSYHPSRSVVVLNGPPIYIQWTNSAFGYVGRSVFQRGLYALKTFLQTMITDQMVTLKAGLLVAKMQQPGSIVNNLMRLAFQQKRQQLKSGVTGNVLTIGMEDAIETLNMQNLEGPAKFARDNCLKNLATSCDMPASMLNQETLAEGFGEGTEDAKVIANFIGGERDEMAPLYEFMDKIVQYRAWNEAFYETIKETTPEYRKVPYATAFQSWVEGYKAIWPNLLTQPDEEKMKGEKARFESMKYIADILNTLVLDPENRATLAMWIAENANGRKDTFPIPLVLDEQAMVEYEPPEVEETTAKADSYPRLAAE